jgi:sulfide dehydrogenase cytochrome subunit
MIQQLLRNLSAMILVLSCSVSVRAGVLEDNCNGCHGPDGISHASDVPSIAGLNFRYFYATMQAFKKDRRRSTIMGRIAKGYKTGQIQGMALYFGRQAWTGNLVAAEPESWRRGQELHREYCEKCHKDEGRFQDKDTPPLAGQGKGYLLTQMHDYRTAATIMPQPPLMQERLEKLADDDLKALSEFYTGRPVETDN